MKRRSFLKQVGLAAAGTFAAPYILPSGRLFAATGSRLAEHVVVCLFAGGVRNLESVQKADGNLMPNLLVGSEPISSDIAPGMDSLPAGPLSQPLQKQGTLYKEFRMAEGPAGHYAAHVVSLTGRYVDSDLSIKSAPPYPTVFELYRKHTSPTKSSLNAWWIANTLGPYPALNYSTYPGYGSQYGANYMQPSSLISPRGFNVLGDMRTFHPDQEAAILEMKDFLNQNFQNQYDPNATGVVNDLNDSERVRNFIETSLREAFNGTYNNFWNVSPASLSNDLVNMFFATKVIEEFKPELLVVNMQDVDICHFNFTEYANNLRKADLAVAHLWNTIQSTPGMANNTVMLVVPEHGRNAQPNTVIDVYGRYAIDHTAVGTSGDQMSREIFCMVLGPNTVVRHDQVVNQVAGESIDIVPTVAKVLGFDTDVPSGLLRGSFLGDAFV